MLGRPQVRLIHRKCIQCGTADSFDVYHQLVPPQANYAFDLMVEVALARLHQQRQDGEIQRQFQQDWGLSLPESSIGSLVQSFLDGLAAVHEAHAPILRAWLEDNGGYAMHLDGSCEPGTDVLFNVLAEPHGWTLQAAKMRTENAAEISHVMQRTVQLFGQPHAVVRDLSSNIEKAVRKVVPDAPDLICHYHFLENVGEKLCEKPHGKLTNALRRLRIRPALKSLRADLVRWSHKGAGLSRAEIESLLSNPGGIDRFDPVELRRWVAYILLRWLDDYTADLKGEYFPFDLPSLAFYRRGLQLNQLLNELLAIPKFPRKDLSVINTMARHLSVLTEDAEAVSSAQRLEKSAALFEELRNVLRLSSCPGKPLLRGRNSSQAESQEFAQRLKDHLQNWRDKLRQRHQRERDEHKRADQAIVLKYLQKYDGHLTGHVIEREGREPLVVSRTNNPVEHRFSSTKRGVRRKVGAKKLTRQVQAMRSDALLAWNLKSPQYVQLVVNGSLASLSSAIAQHWQLAQEIRKKRLAPTNDHPMPTAKKQLRRPNLLETVKNVAKKLVAIIRNKGGRAA
jgi:hypothetical protein